MTESTLRRSRPIEVFPIRTDEDLAAALEQIDALMDAKPGSDERLVSKSCPLSSTLTKSSAFQLATRTPFKQSASDSISSV